MIRHVIAMALALVIAASPLPALVPAPASSATCATIAALVASAPGGRTISLSKMQCEAVTLKRTAPGIVTINAGGSIIRGLTISGSNIRWRSGTIVAPNGVEGKASAVYGLLIRGSAKTPVGNVSVTDTRFGLSRKAVVLDTVSKITLSNNRFDGVGEDGIIASQVNGLTIERNRFVNVVGKPTTCSTASGIIAGLSSRDCVARAGTWTDGYHEDAIQLRNGVKRAVIRFNYIFGKTQGITQMDTTGDAPLEDVLVADNEVWANIHHISLGGTGCVNCRIERNKVRRYAPTAYKAVIRQGPARRCGNDVQDEKADGAC